MSKIYITEFSRLAVDHANIGVQAGIMPGVEQAIDIDRVSTRSSPFSDQTRFIMVYPKQACCIAIGRSDLVKAEIDKHPLGPRELRFYGVAPGDCLAVIEDVDAG